HTRFSRDWSSDVCSSDLLQMGGFPPTADGLEAAILAGWAIIQAERDGETVLLPPDEGLAHYRERHTAVGLSFPVNSAAVGIAVRSEERRVGKGGATRGRG